MQILVQETAMAEKELTDFERKAIAIIEWAFAPEKVCRIRRELGAYAAVCVGTVSSGSPADLEIIKWRDVPYSLL